MFKGLKKALNLRICPWSNCHEVFSTCLSLAEHYLKVHRSEWIRDRTKISLLKSEIYEFQWNPTNRFANRQYEDMWDYIVSRLKQRGLF